MKQESQYFTSVPKVIPKKELNAEKSFGMIKIVKCQKAEIGNQRSEDGEQRIMIINSAKELKVYKTAYKLAMEIFEISKTWPPEERYSLTDQIRRSSRSVCSNLREAWAKRRYEALTSDLRFLEWMSSRI